MKIKSNLVALMILSAAVLPAGALVLTSGPGITNGAPYPYKQTIAGSGISFDVIMDASLSGNPTQQLYVSTFTGLGIQKSPTANTNNISDYRQINADEFLDMTISNLVGGAAVNFTRLSGSSSYFDPGTYLYLYKNGVPVRTNACDGSSSYDIIPPLLAVEGDTISFTPTANVRLGSFEVVALSGFPTNDVPYIPNGAATTNLLNTVINTNGHYYLTGTWTNVTQKPNGVVVKVGNGNAYTKLYYLGATGPATPNVDFDLLVLQPGDTVQVVAGLTGNVGENPGLWNVSLTRYDAWSGSRYSVPVVPLGLASPLSGLDMFQNAWPKSSGFRNDYLSGQPANFLEFVSETLGHAPKCYDEEINSSGNQVPMDSYAQSHPEWQALVHWNGKTIKLFNSDLPEKLSEFKPCHFRYKVGTYLSAAISSSATLITVDDASPFTVGNDAIIVPVDAVTGARQFAGSEMILVTAISGKQLTVTRHIYSGKISNVSSAFAAGSYIAPSAQSDGGGSRYNFALNAPVDEFGRNGGDMVVEMLSNEFAAGNVLERFHGMMFDVLSRSADDTDDCNLDGVSDAGLDSRGVDLYHLGVQGMARKLRAALPDRIITCDGQNENWPALETVFNGIESEGFSHHHDSYTKRFSEAPNYYLYTSKWNPSQYPYNFCTPKQNDLTVDDFIAIYGVTLAATNAYELESRNLRRYHTAGLVALGVVVSHGGIEDGNNVTHAYDEMRNGVAGTLQWMGAPVGPLLRPGLTAPDQLGGAGLPVGGWSSPDGSATLSNSVDGLVVKPVDTGFEHDMVIEFPGISIPSGDLLIRFEGKGSWSYLPADCSRSIIVEVNGRVNNGLTQDQLPGPVNGMGFTEVTAYYRSAGAPGGSTVTLRLTILGAADMTLRNFTIHNATDTLLREFQNGVVLCNPSEKTNTFNLSALFPGKEFRRIQGQSYDDPVVNDGSAVGATVSLAGYRGLFLVKEASLTNVPPSVTIADPLNGQTFPAGTNLYVLANASDGEGSISNVKLYINGQFVRQENIAPYEWGSPTQNDPLLHNLAVGTYVLEVVATDNGGASATNAISVTIAATNSPPAPYSMAITPSGSGGVVISWLSENGLGYQLQGRTNLVQGVWQNIGGPVVGTGGSLSITNTPTGAAGFYRIVAQ